MSNLQIPTRNELQETLQRIQHYVHKTPVLCSRLINEIAGAELYFKCENFQKIGAFKFRGAINAVLQLNDEERKMVSQHIHQVIMPRHWHWLPK